MHPRLGFILCILAALGIHAVILLVPRAAKLEELPVSSVEIGLAAMPVVAEQGRTITPVAARRPAPARTATEPPVENASPQTAAVLPRATPEMTPPPTAEAPPEHAASDSSQDLSLRAVPAIPDTAPGTSRGDNRVATAAGITAPGSAALGSATGGTGTAGMSGSAPIRIAPALIPPRPLGEILPASAYPRSARRAGLEGVVKVSAMVDASGAVLNAEVLVSSGHAALDQAALEAVRRALFAPALQDGEPVACRIVVPIRFQLTAAAPGQ